MRFLSSIFLILITTVVRSQTIEILDRSGKPVLRLKDERLIEVGSNRTLFTIKGNILFEGASDKQEDMELLVGAENIFSKKKASEIMDASQQHTLFSVQNGGFFYQEKSTYEEQWMMAHYRKDEKGNLDLYEGSSDTLICRLPSANITTGKLVAVFYYFSEKYKWDKKMEEVPIAKTQFIDTINAAKNTSGSIRRLWNTGLDEFVWDGTVLKRKWNSFDYEEWTFDGTTLKRLWYPGDEEMVWDGQVLKRKWGTTEDEFEWDGTILRRRWGPIAEEFIIQGNIIKPYLHDNEKDEWQIDGNVPIPLVALVIFGLLRK